RTSNIADGPQRSAGIIDLAPGANRLSIVFHDLEVVFLSDVHDGRHVTTLAKQVNRDNGGGSVGDVGLYAFGIDVEIVFVYIGKHRHETQEGNYFGCCDKCEIWYDNFTPRGKVERHSGELEGIGSISTSDHMTCLEIGSEILLKFPDLWSFDEVSRIHYFPDDLIDFILNRLILALEIDHLNISHISF